MTMTKEQAILLRDVLNDSVNSWHTNVSFPATIEQMIDAKIAFYEPFAKVEVKSCYDGFLDEIRKQITDLKELKTIMEGK